MSAAAVPTEVVVRNLNLNFIPASLGLGRFRRRLKPYVTVSAGSARRPFKTPLGKVGTTGAYSWNSVNELFINPDADVVRIELWHRRLLRRDVLLGIGILPLADLRAASQSGYAIDRWIPIYENPNFTAVQGTGTMMGIVHCICRIVVPASSIALVPMPVAVTTAMGVPAPGAMAGRQQAPVTSTMVVAPQQPQAFQQYGQQQQFGQQQFGQQQYGMQPLQQQVYPQQQAALPAAMQAQPFVKEQQFAREQQLVQQQQPLMASSSAGNVIPGGSIGGPVAGAGMAGAGLGAAAAAGSGMGSGVGGSQSAIAGSAPLTQQAVASSQFQQPLQQLPQQQPQAVAGSLQQPQSSQSFTREQQWTQAQYPQQQQFQQQPLTGGQQQVPQALQAQPFVKEQQFQQGQQALAQQQHQQALAQQKLLPSGQFQQGSGISGVSGASGFSSLAGMSSAATSSVQGVV